MLHKPHLPSGRVYGAATLRGASPRKAESSRIYLPAPHPPKLIGMRSMYPIYRSRWVKTRFDIALQPHPVVRQIMHGLTQCTLCRDLQLGFIQPAFQLGQDRQALFLTITQAITHWLPRPTSNVQAAWPMPDAGL